MNKNFLIKSVFWLTISEIIFNLSGYIIHSGVGRILGPAGYGQYGLVITLTTMIIILIGNGIPTAMSKYLSEFFEKEPEKIFQIKKETAYLQFIIIGLVTIVFYFSIPFIANILNDSQLVPLFKISVLIIPAFASASFYFYYFTGLHKFNLQAILKTIRSLFKIIFILWLAWIWKVKGAIIGYVFAPLSVFLIALIIDYFWLSPKILKNIKKDKLDKNLSQKKVKNFYKQLFNYAWPFVLFTLFYEIMISIDLYMVKGLLHSNSLTGIYNGAITVGRIPYYLFYALTIVLLPTISRSTSLNLNKETKRTIYTTLRLLIIFLLPSIILMRSFASPIIQIFYGNKFNASAPIMSILVWGVGFLTFFYVISAIFNGAGKVKVPMYLALGGAILNASLSYYLIPFWKLKGAAWATNFSSLISAILILFLLYYHFKINFPWLTLIRSFLGGLGIFLLVHFFPQQNLIFIFSSLILIFIYFMLLYILGEIQQKDFFFWKNLFKN